MPYALLAVDVPKDVSAVPTWWLRTEANIAQVEGVEMLTSSLFLCSLPMTLPFLGQLTEKLSTDKLTYCVSIFGEKPEFSKFTPPE